MERFFRQFENPAALMAIVVAVLITLGTVMVYSASGARAGLENIRVMAKKETRPDEDYRFHHGSEYFVKQIMWGAIGLAVGFALMKVPMETIERYALPILVLSFIVLMLVVASPLGMESKGAKRWLRLGPLTLQPSEFAKIALVIFMAKMLSDKREQMKNLFRGFLPAVAIMGFFAILIMLQKDLGTIMLSGCVVVGMWCLAQVRFRHLGSIVLLAMPAVVYLIFQHSYRLNRILAFLDSEKYAMTYGYQLNQSLIAVGSGGLFGQGLGFGLQKYHFLSESHTDFIFAIVCEELGLVGALSVILLFLAFILLGVRISYRAPDYFSGLLAAGLTMIVGCAAFINFFVVLGLAPTKGLALPFFTYGGSSLIASIICTAMLIKISNESLVLRAPAREPAPA
ncbi:putative lipid II flippase FtsW [Candidatus Sumerlaeota bacterium]|nr:putative lipid II flippase FtsW [Candidatus Sumerlaeota bacterium]